METFPIPMSLVESIVDVKCANDGPVLKHELFLYKRLEMYGYKLCTRPFENCTRNSVTVATTYAEEKVQTFGPDHRLFINMSLLTHSSEVPYQLGILNIREHYRLFDVNVTKDDLPFDIYLPFAGDMNLDGKNETEGICQYFAFQLTTWKLLQLVQ